MTMFKVDDMDANKSEYCKFNMLKEFFGKTFNLKKCFRN